MNLQLVSNSVNRVGGINYTNDFTMSLKQPIDGENKEVYITVLNVSYPLTTKNVFGDGCFFSLEIDFFEFKITSHLIFIMPVIKMPGGIYTIQMIVDYMNSYLEEFGVEIDVATYGKIVVNFYLQYEYWFKQFKSSNGRAFNGGSLNDFQKGTSNNAKINMKLKMSDKLKFMLGFESNEIKIDSATFSEDIYTHVSENLPDPSDGVNNIYIYCDQIEKTLIGDSESQLLAIVPLQIKGQGSGELSTYAPPLIERKMLKTYIENFHITLCDARGDLISFDSGSVNIECKLSYND